MPRRSEKKYHYFYKTTCKITKNYYYGIHSTNNLKDGYLGSGKRLRYSIRKYGSNNHICEKLEFFENREKLSIKEKEIVDINEISKNKCMNIIEGGDHFTSSIEHTKISSKGGKAHAMKLKDDPEYRKRVCASISMGIKRSYKNGRIGKNSYSWKGKKFSDEHKRKMSESSKGIGMGNKNAAGGAWVFNLELKKNKRIKQEELGIYINNGWIKGRKMKFYIV